MIVKIIGGLQCNCDTACCIRANPNALIIPRIYLGTPEFWQEDPNNFSEMEIMDDGTSQSRDYSDWTTESPGILPREGNYPSLASTAWREDTAMTLEHMIDHIAESNYANYIVGYKISGLATEEWYHWSSGRSELSGYSDPTIDAFRTWLRVKYSDSNSALQTAWQDGSVTFDDANVPSYTDRKLYTGTRTFRDPNQYMNVIDFERFYNELIPETMNYFAGVIKDKYTDANKVIVGGFYSYLYEFQGNPDFGHNALEKYNECNNLDYVYVTASYGERKLGGADYPRGPALSVKLHDKIWYNNNDLRTYLSTNSAAWTEGGYTGTMDGDRQELRRSQEWS